MLSSKNAPYSICLTDIVKHEPKQLVLISLTRLCLPRIPPVSPPASLWDANRRSSMHTGFLVGSTSESKDWQSLPRPVVECIQVQGVRVAKESGLISKSLVA